MPAGRTLEHQAPPRRGRFSYYDLPVAAGVFALIYGLVSAGRGMTQPAGDAALHISLDPLNVPYYLLRSTVRMFIAYGWSLAFTFVVGPLAAHSRRAERIILPAVDILQSVPVLGFLAVTVNAFMALFPGSVLGMELASIFAIFTSMVWNMFYSFYQSSRGLPRDLVETSAAFGLTRFQRFMRLEVPYSMIGLVWNSMVSFGGGWFFLAASEAIAVLGKNIHLPGIGSYLAAAVDAGDMRAVFIAIGATLLVVVALDVFFFRPLLAWAQRFQTGTEATYDYESDVLTALQRSRLMDWLWEHAFFKAWDATVNRLPARLASLGFRRRGPRTGGGSRWVGTAVALVILVTALVGAGYAGVGLASELTRDDVVTVVLAGLFTLVRVAVCVLLASAIWVPIGTFIGFRPDLARRLRPVIQLLAAFPANLVFPLLVLGFVRAGIDLSYGSVLLMLVASQWYILFNVIVGAMTVPRDLADVASSLRLSRWQRLRTVIFPVVFPYWVTGALTCAGGAWNVSIVAEVARLGDTHLSAFGLGAYIADATVAGRWPGILFSIAYMCVLVVLTNRLFWRRLYRYAEEHLAWEGADGGA
jgi:NitT/TauT family transport system permease protein